jgi:hypothetical protein
MPHRGRMPERPGAELIRKRERVLARHLGPARDRPLRRWSSAACCSTWVTFQSAHGVARCQPSAGTPAAAARSMARASSRTAHPVTVISLMILPLTFPQLPDGLPAEAARFGLMTWRSGVMVSGADDIASSMTRAFAGKFAPTPEMYALANRSSELSGLAGAQRALERQPGRLTTEPPGLACVACPHAWPAPGRPGWPAPPPPARPAEPAVRAARPPRPRARPAAPARCAR